MRLEREAADDFHRSTADRCAGDLLRRIIPNRVVARLPEAGVVKDVGSSRVDLQACKLEYSIVSPK